MNDKTSQPAERLQRVLALTPSGEQELRQPRAGLSLPQRWLLAQIDGEATLVDLARRPGSPAAQRLPRNAAKLVGLGLAGDVGEGGPALSDFGPASDFDAASTFGPVSVFPPTLAPQAAAGSTPVAAAASPTPSSIERAQAVASTRLDGQAPNARAQAGSASEASEASASASAPAPALPVGAAPSLAASGAPGGLGSTAEFGAAVAGRRRRPLLAALALAAVAAAAVVFWPRGTPPLGVGEAQALGSGAPDRAAGTVSTDAAAPRVEQAREAAAQDPTPAATSTADRAPAAQAPLPRLALAAPTPTPTPTPTPKEAAPSRLPARSSVDEATRARPAPPVAVPAVVPEAAPEARTQRAGRLERAAAVRSDPSSVPSQVPSAAMQEPRADADAAAPPGLPSSALPAGPVPGALASSAAPARGSAASAAAAPMPPSAQPAAAPLSAPAAAATQAPQAAQAVQPAQATPPSQLAAAQVLPPSRAAAPTAVAAKALGLRPSSVVEPAFPREGWGLGSRVVTLQARLSLDAAGSVTRVDFLRGSSGATRIFERAARNALLQWRFPPGAADRTYTQELSFREE